MSTKTPIFLADKTKLSIGDTVISNVGIAIITDIKNGGCIGEYIASAKYWLSHATLYTTDINKSHTILGRDY